MATTDFPAEIRDLRSTLESIRAVSDPTVLKARIATLSEQASAPDLWDDPEHAQQVTSALSATQAELDRVDKLAARIDDLEALAELAAEEDDADTVVEAEGELVAIRALSTAGSLTARMDSSVVRRSRISAGKSVVATTVQGTGRRPAGRPRCLGRGGSVRR